MQMKVKTKTFHYTVGLRWKDGKRGVMTAAGKPEVETASPPEFRGHAGIWSPEDLLVASVNACTMMTFLSMAERKKLEIVAYDSDADGTLEMADGKFRFTCIVVHPRIVLAKQSDCDRAVAVFHDAKEACLIANSLLTKVEGEPEISVR